MKRSNGIQYRRSFPLTTSILIKHQWDDAELPDVLVTRGVVGQYLPDAVVVLSPEVTS